MTMTKPKTKLYVGFSTDLPDRKPLVHKNHIPYWPMKCSDPGRVLAVVDSLADLEDMWPGVLPSKIDRVPYFRFSNRTPRLKWFVPLPGDEDFWLDAGADLPVFDPATDRILKLMDEFDSSWARWLCELGRQATGTGFGCEGFPHPPELNEDQFLDLDQWLDGSTSADELSVRAFGSRILMTVRGRCRVFSYDLVKRDGWHDSLPYRTGEWDLNDVHDLLSALLRQSKDSADYSRITHFLNNHPQINTEASLLSQILIYGGSGGVVVSEFYGRCCLRFFTTHHVVEFIHQSGHWIYLRTEHLTAQHLLDNVTQATELFDQAVLNQDSDAVHDYLANLRSWVVASDTTLSEFSRRVSNEQSHQQQGRWGVAAVGPAMLFFSREFDVEQTPLGICVVHHDTARTAEEMETMRIHYSLFEEALDAIYHNRGNSGMWQALNSNRVHDPEGFDRLLTKFMASLSWVDDANLQAAHQGDVFSFGKFAIALGTLELLPAVPQHVFDPTSYASNYLPEFMRRSKLLTCGLRCVVTSDYAQARNTVALLEADNLQVVARSSPLVFSLTPPEFLEIDIPSSKPLWALLRSKSSKGGCLVVWIRDDGWTRYDFSDLLVTLRSIDVLANVNIPNLFSLTERELRDLAVKAVGGVTQLDPNLYYPQE